MSLPALQPVEVFNVFQCSPFTVPQGGYLQLSLTTSSILIIFYGNGVPTDFQVVNSADTA